MSFDCVSHKFPLLLGMFVLCSYFFDSLPMVRSLPLAVIKQ